MCPKCEADRFVKNGVHHGRQRFKCTKCGYQYTKEGSRYSRKEKAIAVALYSYGLSFRTIAKMYEISPNTICLWARELEKSGYQKPSPESVVERLHYLLKKFQNHP